MKIISLESEEECTLLADVIGLYLDSIEDTREFATTDPAVPGLQELLEFSGSLTDQATILTRIKDELSG